MKKMIDAVQEDAIRSIDTNVFVSAGAGTGKTHVLVQRFIELLIQKKADVSEIAAITFTEKAANEMKDRIREECNKRSVADPVWERHKRDLENSRIGTIHGFCARLIRENPIQLGIDPLSDVLDEIESMTLMSKFIHARLLKLIEDENPDSVLMVSGYGFKETKNIIWELIKNRMDIDILLEKYRDEKSTDIDKRIFALYEIINRDFAEYKKKERLLDFNDLIIYAKNLLRDNKSVRRFYQKMIKYILVDEYQDTDFHQRDIIFYLAEDGAISMSSGIKDIVLSKDKLFIVGDKKQSIYRFRGADVSVFEDTKRILEKAGRCLDLSVNMRTTPSIIGFFNSFFGEVMGREKRGKEDYESVYDDIKPFREKDIYTPGVEFLSVPYGEEDLSLEIRRKEADMIAGKILYLVNNKVQFKDIAVLFRAMTDIKIYEDAFKRYKIPYYVIAGSGFYVRQEVKDILNYLKIIEDENDRIALTAVLRSPMAGLTDNELVKDIKPSSLIADIKALRDIKDNVPISTLIQEIIRRTNYRAVLSAMYMGEQLVSNINKIIDIARRFESKGIFNLSDFIEYLDELTLVEPREGEAPVSEEEANVVSVMTIHKAKGLEFPVVFVPDVSRKPKAPSGSVLYDKKFIGLGVRVKDEDGELKETPLRKMIKEEIEKKQLAESKRLLYVASTRAKDYLIYSGRFDEKDNNTWASWLKKNVSNPEMFEAAPRTCPNCPEIQDVRGAASNILNLSAQDVLKQIEPLPLVPQRFFTATELTRHDVQVTPASSAALNLGIETHDFFQKWDFNEKNLPENEKIRNFVFAFMKDLVFDEIKTASEIYKELPITFKHNDSIIEGVIDLLYKNKDGKWVLLDYKTDNISKEDVLERVKDYKIQLSIYAAGIEKILKIKPERMIVFFLSPGVCYSFQ